MPWPTFTRHTPEPMRPGEVSKIARSYATTHGARTAQGILDATNSWRRHNGLPPLDTINIPDEEPEHALKELSNSIELARFFKCTTQAISDLARAGHLTFEWVHPGRLFHRTDVETFIQSDRGQRFLKEIQVREGRRGTPGT